jgi:amino acid adenylation domain-containing protein
MSYEELNRRSDHFAQYLFNNKVRSGSTVAICMDRSFEWIVAALGILKAGAAYVPLDPSWPEARLLYAVNDSDAVAVIAPDALLARLQLRVPGIDPVRDAVEIGTAPLVERHSIESGNLAYIIYTSGSTGTPKGVEITHANLCHLIEWHIKAFQLTASDRASHLAGLGFDAAVWEIWSTLAAGATLCIPDDTVRLSPELIQEWLVQSQVTISFVPTVHAARLIQMNWPANTALRFLLTGGDVLHHFPAPDLPFTLVNNYGPTECTVVATSGLVNPQGAGMPSIGKPIHDTFVYLLDEQGQPVQEGQIGEIYIGGGGVGRGYRNLPDATRKSFLPDPFSQAPSTYMYRTGDRGLRRADGQLEFHGRADRQVKIRGQRIELDEISNLLSQYPGVQFGIVTANNSDKGQAELTGHVLFTLEAQAPRAAELQEYLVKHLPSYMVPSKFFRLRELPVSANGKIDLAILSRAVSEPLQSAKHLATPKNDIQAQLLTAVRELLKNPTLGPRDNFFLAGGHSLLGMQLIMRLRETYRVDMTVRELFDVPTVEHLSLMIQRKRAQVRLTSIWEELLRTEQCGPDDTFMSLGGNDHLLDELQLRIAGEFGRYLTRTQLVENPTITTQTALVAAALGDTLLPPGAFMVHSERKRDNIFWLHYPNPKLAEALGPERPLLCLTLTEQDFDTLGEAPTLQEIARRFVPKLLASQSHGPYIVGGFCLGGILSYEVACQLQAAGYEVSLVILLDVPSPDYYRPAELSKLIRRPVYVTKRLKQLGLRKTLVRLLERASQKIQVKAERALVPEHSIRTQEIMETAAYRYTPKRYEGDVALIMASELTPDSPPHEHFLPWWRGIISKTLHEHEIDAIHLDLVEGAAVIQVAEAISSHINQTTKGSLLSNGEIVGAADNAPQLSYGLSGNKARETFSKAAATISTPVTSSAKLTKTPASQLQ